MNDYELSTIISRLKLIKYLLSKADQRGYTHGEKHHIIEVCLIEVSQALNDCKEPASLNHRDTDVRELQSDDIPF